ncbi:MAG: nitrilase-related carbon-nitrogen hydrolase, partial [Nitrospinales bacterium]
MTRSTKKPLKTRKKNDEAGDKVRIAIAQINTIVGDFPHNVEQIKNCLREAKESRADIILFPELTLTGYPPEDLLLKKDFVKKNLSALKSLARYTKGITAVIGFAEPVKNQIYNSAALIANGKYLGSYQEM